MSATFAKIGNTTMVLDNIRDLQIRRRMVKNGPSYGARYALHINNRGTPCYSGTRDECERLREVILETLHTYFNVDVIDLGEGIIDERPDENLGEDSDSYVGL